MRKVVAKAEADLTASHFKNAVLKIQAFLSPTFGRLSILSDWNNKRALFVFRISFTDGKAFLHDVSCKFAIRSVCLDPESCSEKLSANIYTT